MTKDEDFAQLADRQTTIPPQALRIRLGNCRKAALLKAFADVLPQIIEQLQEGHPRSGVTLSFIFIPT